MKEEKKKLPREFIVPIVLILLNAIVWSFYLSQKENDILEVSFLDIGQGDAIFIEAPNGTQMLIDAGRDTAVLNELGRSMSFFDRSIDVVLVTHPDQDHIGGIPAVLENYEVGKFIDSFADTESSTYDEMNRRVLDEGAEYFVGVRGMLITLDQENGVYFHILHPEPDEFAVTETNDLSIIGKLVYGDTSFMLTGDAGKAQEAMLYATDGEYLHSSVLKAGHHGSKTSSSAAFVKIVDSTYAVISAGKDNSYGHPHKEVIDTLEKENIEILSTAEQGTIKFLSNGVDVWEK